MPPLTRWFIKTALVYLVLSLILGVLVVAGPALQLLEPLAGLSSLYLQLLMIGWITQLIFGVANWMFPIFTREEPRRNPNLGWLAYALINVGLIVQLGSDLLLALGIFPVPPWTGGVSALLLFLAAQAFVVNIWYRIKGH